MLMFDADSTRIWYNTSSMCCLQRWVSKKNKDEHEMCRKKIRLRNTTSLRHERTLDLHARTGYEKSLCQYWTDASGTLIMSVPTSRSLPQARAEMRKMTPMIASKAGCAAPPDRPITLPKPRRDFAALCACLNAFLGFLAAVGRRRQNQQDSPTLSLLRQSIARASAHHLSHFLQLAFLVIAILRNSSCR